MTTGILANILGPDGLIVIVVLAIVLLFGGAKLPQLARGLGSASHEFKKGMAEGDPDGGTQSLGSAQPQDHAGQSTGSTFSDGVVSDRPIPGGRAN